MASNIEIKNKKAEFLYELYDTYTAGMELYGTEIKSIRSGKANLTDSYCYFRNGELWVKMHISEYSHGSYNNHEPRRERKLLLTKRELKKLENRVKLKGFTIIPTMIFMAENGYAKMEIYTAKGKRKYDKRNSLKQKDAERELDRMKKF